MVLKEISNETALSIVSKQFVYILKKNKRPTYLHSTCPYELMIVHKNTSDRFVIRIYTTGQRLHHMPSTYFHSLVSKENFSPEWLVSSSVFANQCIREPSVRFFCYE